MVDIVQYFEMKYLGTDAFLFTIEVYKQKSVTLIPDYNKVLKLKDGKGDRFRGQVKNRKYRNVGSDIDISL